MQAMNTTAHAPLFLSHGSPMTALEPREAGAFMQHLGSQIDNRFGRPRALLMVSAHTSARMPVLLGGSRHQAIYDFGGFDPKLQTLRYDVPGAPQLAGEVQGLLEQAGIEVARVDQGGLDHGIWVPLRYMYPEADIPVLPLAFVPSQSPAQQFALGEALSQLAADGVQIIGSGSITHNLRKVFMGNPAIDAEEIEPSAAFRNWMVERSAARDWEALFNYRRLAPHALDMHPTDEHLLPWYVAAGAGGREAAPRRIHASLTFGCLGMDAYAFGPEAARWDAV